MSVEFDASTESYVRTTGLPSITSFTMMIWVNPTTIGTPADSKVVMTFGTGSDRYTPYIAHSTEDFYAWNGANNEITGFNANEGEWFHFCMTCTGTGTTDVRYYFNGDFDTSANGRAANSAGEIRIGKSEPNDQYFNGSLACYKEWDRVLSDAEVENEAWSQIPVHWDQLNCWLPMFDETDLTDYSGNGNDFTKEGTPVKNTAKTTPPIGWGTRHKRIFYIPDAAASVPKFMYNYRKQRVNNW